jgi:hypothetical protein
MISEITRRRTKIAETLKSWPHNVLRKSEPILWEEIRRLAIGRLDASVLPQGMELKSGTHGKLVIGNLNDVIPNVKEEWKLPDNFERTVPSQPRSTTWLQDEVVDDLGQFLANEVNKKTSQIEELRLKTSQADNEKSKKEDELAELILQLESLIESESGSTNV